MFGGSSHQVLRATCTSNLFFNLAFIPKIDNSEGMHSHKCPFSSVIEKAYCYNNDPPSILQTRR